MSEEANLKLRKTVEQRLMLLETQRWSWFQNWRLLARYIQPRLGRFTPFPNPGNRGSPKNQHIINSTATISAQRFAAGLLSGASSPDRPWFRLRLAGSTDEPTGEVRAWLDMVGDRMMTVFGESNFYDSIATMYEEEGVFGTAAELIYDDFEDVVRFYPLAAGEYYLAVNARLEVDTLYRKFLLTIAQMVDKFGEDKCSPQVKALYENDQLETEIIIAHAVEPNDDRVQGAFGFRGMPFREVYWEWGQKGTALLKTAGYHEKPFSAPRWNVTSNDAYGRSPGMDAMGDVIQIQIEEKRKAQAIDKVVNPPMIADARLRNEPASTIPGGVTFAPPGVEAMKPMYQIEPRIDFMVQDIERCETRVKSAFFEDLFMMISQIDRDMTAFEVAKRQEEKMLMLGPPLMRNHKELLKNRIERTFGLMSRVRLPDGSSLIPPPPSQISGRHLKVEFVSILAQAQKAVATGAIERTFQFAGGIAALKPEVMDNLDADQAIRDYSDLIGVPTNIVVPDAKVADIRTRRQQQQQIAAALQTGTAAAQGAETLSKTDVGGGMNAISMMTGLGPSKAAA